MIKQKNKSKLWCFEPFDTWFFRESRSLDTVSGSELDSVFPPPARTVLGAIRSLIGENKQVNWNNFPKQYPEIEKEIGNSDGFGKLRLSGLFLIYEGERLFPVPLSLMRMDNEAGFHFLKIGDAVDCDLGSNVRLPKLDVRGGRPFENAWLAEDGLRKVLIGELPDRVICQSDLFKSEPRLGIVRNRRTGAVEEGLLFQCRHLRMSHKVKVGVVVEGVGDSFHLKSKECSRFGGEGRLAGVEVVDKVLSLPKIAVGGGQNLLLMLLTPADLSGSWLPSADFKRVVGEDGVTVWDGEVNGVELCVVSAVLGKAIGEGGWDLRRHCPRPLRSLVPAGSVWFCRVKGSLAVAVEKLRGFHVGSETELGRGELIAGVWK
jgi:CRISPR-associated protein Cmr3